MNISQSMKKSVYLLSVIMPLSLGLAACNGNSDSSVKKTPTNDIISHPGPGMIVYKTKGDYQNLVQVWLTDDKKLINGFPDQSDLLTKPVNLNQGYLFGFVNKNTAFTKYTYEAYASQSTTMNSLYDDIVDNDPLLEAYDCGHWSGEKPETVILNEIIDNNELKTKCESIL